MNINLLPWRQQRLQKMWYQFLSLSGGCIMIVMTLIILLHFMLVAHNRSIFSQYIQLQHKMPIAITQPAADDILLLNKIVLERKHMLTTLRVIVQALPHNCYLTQLQYHDSWLIQGCASDMQSISEFMLHLKRYHRFHEITLTNVVNQKNHKLFIYSIHLT